MTLKANRGKKRYFGFHQINKFCASKGTIKKGNTSLESLCTICGNIKLFFWYGKQYDGSSEDTEVIWDSAIPLLGVCSKESKIWADTCTLVYRAIIHNNKNVEATQESIKDDWISKIEHTCNRILFRFNEKRGLPRWLSGKESAFSAGDSGDAASIPELGRSPGGGNGNPLQYSCLGNPMDRGAWRATVHGAHTTGGPTQLSK